MYRLLLILVACDPPGERLLDAHRRGRLVLVVPELHDVDRAEVATVRAGVPGDLVTRLQVHVWGQRPTAPAAADVHGVSRSPRTSASTSSSSSRIVAT